MPTPNCTGGLNASLQVNNLDCNCVSISSITWNASGTQFTITLNNGQSITSPVLTGPAGSAPTITFRTSGTMLQYNVNGGSWIDLYDFSNLTGSQVLHNDIGNSVTAGTSLETLKTYSMPAGTLSTDGSYIEVFVRFRTTTTTTTSSAKLVEVLFNSGVVTISLFNSIDNLDVYEHKFIISRFSNTSGRSKYEITSINNSSSNVLGAKYGTFNTLAGLDFNGTAYNIDVKANSDVIGDLRCEAFIITKYPKP